MAHNVESLIWQRYHETESNTLKRWYIKKQWDKFETFERWAFAKASRTVTVSADDAALARQRFNAKRVEVVDNGVDTRLFQPGRTSREPHSVLFLGSLDWRPNIDAVNVLLDQIFPAVRSQEPDSRLIIVGRKSPRWMVDRVNREENVELHGDVPDVRAYLNHCTVMAVPLRIGEGSRLKILEALATQTPVVSTQIGAEGLHLESGTHLYVVENTEGIADALVHSMRNPDESMAMAKRGREVILDLYDWDALSRKLEDIWVSCVAS
jgi:glycosyltransferase involved in cell wall biosynthesis